jgi:RND family efflux transporter MFP subunit
MNRTLLLTSLSGMFLLASCGGEEPGALPPVTGSVDVRVSPLTEAASTLSFPAVASSDQEADLATRMSGAIRTLRVHVGDRVRTGDLLVELDEADLRARLAQVRAAEALAETSHQRLVNLVRDRAASQHELDQATAALEAARGQRQEVEAQLTYTTLRAPFDGIITRRMADPGDLTAPGRPILTLTGVGTLKFVADLPAQRSGSVRIGDPVMLRIDGVAAPIPGTIQRVVDAVGAQARTFRVEARATQAIPEVIPGTYARMEFPQTDAPTRWLPADALVRQGQLTGVFTVEDNRLRLRWIRTGQMRGDAVEFLSGPMGIEEVVRRPGAELRDGLSVGTRQIEAWVSGGQEGVSP